MKDDFKNLGNPCDPGSGDRLVVCGHKGGASGETLEGGHVA